MHASPRTRGSSGQRAGNVYIKIASGSACSYLGAAGRRLPMRCRAAVDVETIDRINILQATLLAMERAVRALPTSAGYVLVDGNRVPTVGAAALRRTDTPARPGGAAATLAARARRAWGRACRAKPWWGATATVTSSPQLPSLPRSALRAVTRLGPQPGPVARERVTCRGLAVRRSSATCSWTRTTRSTRSTASDSTRSASRVPARSAARGAQRA